VKVDNPYNRVHRCDMLAYPRHYFEVGPTSCGLMVTILTLSPLKIRAFKRGSWHDEHPVVTHNEWPTLPRQAQCISCAIATAEDGKPRFATDEQIIAVEIMLHGLAAIWSQS